MPRTKRTDFIFEGATTIDMSQFHPMEMDRFETAGIRSSVGPPKSAKCVCIKSSIKLICCIYCFQACCNR